MRTGSLYFVWSQIFSHISSIPRNHQYLSTASGWWTPPSADNWVYAFPVDSQLACPSPNTSKRTGLEHESWHRGKETACFPCRIWLRLATYTFHDLLSRKEKDDGCRNFKYKNYRRKSVFTKISEVGGNQNNCINMWCYIMLTVNFDWVRYFIVRTEIFNTFCFLAPIHGKNKTQSHQ